MHTLETSTEPRRKRAPRPKQVASKAVGKSILYISAWADSEFDLITSFIGELFGRSVRPYPWEKPEVDDEEFRKEDPCLIIMSAPPEKWELELDECYVIVKRAFPVVPILWLAPTDGYEAKSAAGDELVTVLNTETIKEPMYPFISCISELIGVKPKVAAGKEKE